MNGRVERAVGAWVLAAALAACSSSRLPPSVTPRITDDPSASRDTSLLLTEADVRAVEGFEDVSFQDLTDAGAFQNPDPRGPCGARVTEPPLAGTYGRAFTAPGVVVVQILQPSSAESKAYVDALKADLRPGCGPFTSRTNQGLVQQVSSVTPVALPRCDRCVGSTGTVTVQDQTAYVGVLVYDTPTVYGGVQVMAESPIPAVVAEIFGRALSRLPA